MFVVNNDNSIYLTRGDIAFFSVNAKAVDKNYKFSQGDVLRINIFGKKDSKSIYLQKDFYVASETEEVEMFLSGAETKIGDTINKPKDYWYEIVLNPNTTPQTIIGYDEEGPKILKLFPEGEDNGDLPDDENSNFNHLKQNISGKIDVLKTLHGHSAYEIAVMYGFKGTEEEWLESLKGYALTEKDKEDIADLIKKIDLTTAKAINNFVNAHEGTITFKGGMQIEIKEPIYLYNKRNMVIDFNGCNVIADVNYDSASSPDTSLGYNFLLAIDNSENITIKNAIFDCNTENNLIKGFQGAVCRKSSVVFENCVFKNSGYHHIVLHGGTYDFNKISFYNLGYDSNGSDVYTTASMPLRTNWKNITSIRPDFDYEKTHSQVFYFGCTDDEQKNEHFVDGLYAENCGNPIDLRGGLGVFRNIVADNCSALIVQSLSSVVTNRPKVTFENLTIYNSRKDLSMPIAASLYVYGCKECDLKNIRLEGFALDDMKMVDTNNEITPIAFRPLWIRQNTQDSSIIVNNVKISAETTVHTIVDIQSDTGTMTCLIENLYSEIEATEREIFVHGNGTVNFKGFNIQTPLKKLVKENNANVEMLNVYKSIGTESERPTLWNCESAIYYNKDTSTMQYWNGSNWSDI